MFHSGQWKRIFWLVQPINFFPVQCKRIFFNESFIPAIGKGFSHQFKASTLLESSFLLAETVSDMSGNHFSKERPYSCRRNSFLFSLPQIFFKQFFIPAWKHIFQSRRKSIAFYLDFFSCQWKPLFRLWTSLFKALITAIGNDFLFFLSNISTNVSSFSSSINVFLNTFSIPTSGNSGNFLST